MKTMDCKQTRNLLSEYQDGILDAATEAALADHLRGCPECAGCAGSLLAVRELLKNLPPDPAPPDLIGRVLAAVDSEDRDVRAHAAPKRGDAATPFFSRFGIPLEAAAAVLLFASLYWYQQTSTRTARPPSTPTAQASGTAHPAGISAETSSRTAKNASPGVRLPRGNPKTAKEETSTAAKPRTWTVADLPSVPIFRASTDSGRIVPFAPSPGPATDPASEEGADSRTPQAFGAPPSRLFRPLPYGRDIVMNVNPENREGTEERVVAVALRLGGIVERIERGTAGTVRVVLPEDAAARFVEEMGRIGAVPPAGLPPAIDIPAGPRPGTVAYTVRIR